MDLDRDLPGENRVTFPGLKFVAGMLRRPGAKELSDKQLELVWRLSGYGYSLEYISSSPKSLLGLSSFKPRHGVAIAMEVVWYDAGMNLHRSVTLVRMRV